MSRQIILAWHVNRSAGAGCVLTVAIESRIGEGFTSYFKAYRRTFDHYPTETDISETANAGAKVEQWEAENIFADLRRTGHKYDG